MKAKLKKKSLELYYKYVLHSVSDGSQTQNRFLLYLGKFYQAFLIV